MIDQKPSAEIEIRSRTVMAKKVTVTFICIKSMQNLVGSHFTTHDIYDEN